MAEEIGESHPLHATPLSLQDGAEVAHEGVVEVDGGLQWGVHVISVLPPPDTQFL